MNMKDMPAGMHSSETDDGDALALLLASPVQSTLTSPGSVSSLATTPAIAFDGIRTSTLLALADGGATPVVDINGKGVRARSIIDLHGTHVGKSITLMFEGGDAERPIVMGLLRDNAGWPLEEGPDQVQVDADGQRLVVTAKEQLVLRCGKASITLTKAGKVLIDGTYLLNRSSGVNRIKGGAVQLN
jgi:hypothetical protein